MQSNNPIFNRSEGFNGKAYAGFGDAPVATTTQTRTSYGTGRMTIDSVVQSTAASVAIVIVAAAVTWLVSPAVSPETGIPSSLVAASTIGGGAAFILSMVNSFKRVISPALVIAFAVAEGVALGALSEVFNAVYGGGLIVQAVLGTFAAFAGTLAAYKVLDIKVGQKFRTFVVAAMFGMVALSLLEVVLGLFGSGLGLFDDGAMGLVFAAAGLVLGVFMLILDFDFVENGIRAGLDERESWRAAFAMTVSLVWIYTNLLRILAILQND
ncbi:MAG: Bax inhibitor-1/YccA family protein [Nocardioides sp.]|uniref:Bax inhibitor-1/YccA family protein n=1 Tax=Nocardioides sp. TaxID=35761 RepID=UPI0039E24245